MPLNLDDIDDPNVTVTEYIVMQPKRIHNEKMGNLADDLQKSLLSGNYNVQSQLSEIEAASKEEETNIIPVGGRMKLKKLDTRGGGAENTKKELEENQKKGNPLKRTLSGDANEYIVEEKWVWYQVSGVEYQVLGIGDAERYQWC